MRSRACAKLSRGGPSFAPGSLEQAVSRTAIGTTDVTNLKSRLLDARDPFGMVYNTTSLNSRKAVEVTTRRES
jgi:hypothetical protein